ncbi:twin-arginine translocation signal domain-containing protein, partial [Longimicrobium sp.]
MSHENDDLPTQDPETQVTNRREFLGRSAVMAAAAVGAPALLAACDA